MKNIIKKVKESKMFGKVLGGILMAQFVVLGCPLVVRADTGEPEPKNALLETTFFKGLTKLLKDFGALLVVLEVVVAGVLWGVEWFKLQQADDTEKPKHKKNIKMILISAAIIVSGTGLVTVILGYFQ